MSQKLKYINLSHKRKSRSPKRKKSSFNKQNVILEMINNRIKTIEV